MLVTKEQRTSTFSKYLLVVIHKNVCIRFIFLAKLPCKTFFSMPAGFCLHSSMLVQSVSEEPLSWPRVMWRPWNACGAVSFVQTVGERRPVFMPTRGRNQVDCQSTCSGWFAFGATDSFDVYCSESWRSSDGVYRGCALMISRTLRPIPFICSVILKLTLLLALLFHIESSRTVINISVSS